MRINYSLKIIFKVTLFIIIAIVWLWPFWWMIITSLKTPQEILQYPPTLYPHNITFSSYFEVFKRVPLLSFFKNSLITAFSVTIVAVFSSTL